MNRHYLKDEGLKEGDIIYFEMPAFCSGEYSAEIAKDSNGWFTDSPHFDVCCSYTINKPMWRKLNPVTLQYED